MSQIFLLYGYSGCGKTTVPTQFHGRFPDHIHLITDFTSLSPANLIVKIGKFTGLPLKLRLSEIFTLQDRLKSMSSIMYLMDEVSLDEPRSFTELELLRKIYMEIHAHNCICGVPRLYYQLYDSRHYDKYSSLSTRLDEHEMRGMRQENAENYLNMVAEKEALCFTNPAHQALTDPDCAFHNYRRHPCLYHDHRQMHHHCQGHILQSSGTLFARQHPLCASCCAGKENLSRCLIDPHASGYTKAYPDQ